MDNQTCIFLGIKVKPGPIERHKLENYALDNTVDSLKTEAEKKANVPSTSLELIHHGKILKDDLTLHDSGVKNGEMVHVVVKKVQAPPAPPPTFTDNDLQLLNTSLRTLGCTPNAPGWTRAMQLLNDESAMAEIIEEAPNLGEDCVALSILHEVELLAALGANIHTMRRGANAHPDLPAALRHLTRLVRSRNSTSPTDSVPTSGFAYSLEALSEDEDADEEETEETERNPITQEQLTAALQAATDAISTSSRRNAPDQESILRRLQPTSSNDRVALPPLQPPPAPGNGPATDGALSSVITDEMFSAAIQGAFMGSNRLNSDGTPQYPATEELARIAADIEIRDRINALAAQSIASRLGSSDAEPTVECSSAEPPMECSLEEPTITYPRTEQGSPENQPQPNLIPDIAINTEAASSSSQTSVARENSEDFSTQLSFMHEMGLLEDALNVRALIICAGDVNAAINLVFSGAIGDE